MTAPTKHISSNFSVENYTMIVYKEMKNVEV